MRRMRCLSGIISGLWASVLLKIVRRYAGIYGLLLGFSPTNFLSLAFLKMNIIFLRLPIRNRKRCLGWAMLHESQTTRFSGGGGASVVASRMMARGPSARETKARWSKARKRKDR